MQSKDATGSDTANLYTLMNLLVGTSQESADARVTGADVPGRTQLTETYDVPNTPTAPFPPGTSGYLFINYNTGENFNQFIASLCDNGVSSMTGQAVTASVKERTQRPPPWQTSPLFNFLLLLASDTSVNDSFHAAFPGGTAAQQKAFFDSYLPPNYYGEQDAVTALMQSTSTPDFSKLLTTFNVLVTTFNAQYGLCC